MIKMSNTSKMKITGKKVKSWSLEARVTCPMSKDVEVCKSCYATKGMYRFPVVKNVRQHNRDDYKTPDWEQRMITECNKLDYVRLFDSGDCETVSLAIKLEQVIKACKNTKFWLPSRMDKDRMVGAILHKISKLPNVSLRLSADNIGLDKSERPGVNSYVIRNTVEDLSKAKERGIHICPVNPNTTQKSCDTCTMCYTDKPVAYIVH